MDPSNSGAAAYDPWADYYDFGEGDRTPYISFYSSLISTKTQSILELGCGTGAIATVMAEKVRLRERSGQGVRIVGIDSSPGMLKVARSRDSAIEWHLGDMRLPPVQGPFDFVFCCFNTLQFLLRSQDLAQTFATVRDLLQQDGIFAFDIYKPNVAYLLEPKTDRLARAVTDDRGRNLEIREDTSYDPGAHVLKLNWRMVDRDRPSDPPLASTSYRLRQYFPAEIDSLLAAAGLVVHERYGEFDRSPFDESSRKQILVCGRH